MTLVSGGGRRHGGWLPTLAVIGMLVLGFVAVAISALTHHYARAKPAVARSGIVPPARSLATPPPSMAASPSGVKPSPAAQTVSNDVPVRPLPSTPNPVAVVSPTTELPVATPPPLASTPVPRGNPIKVHVETHPSGAEIRLAGKLLGTTPLDVTLPPGEHQLIAHYRNWAEVRHTLHLDADQLTALEDIHMMSPTAMIPPIDGPASPGAKKHPVAASTPRRDAVRSSPTTAGNAIVHFPTPSVSVPSSRGPEPFLAQPTPVRRARPGLTPFDPDGALDPAPRRRAPELPPLPSDDSAD